MNKSASMVLATCRCDDGGTRILYTESSFWAGTRMDPPEHDSTYEVWTERQLRKFLNKSLR